MTLFTSRSLGELVAEAPARAAVLDRLGLDYCCHGDRSLGTACAESGLDATIVAGELRATAAEESIDHPADPAGLTVHIESVHHGYLHAELPELEVLAAKVLGVHGERHPELGTVRDLTVALRAELEPHLMKEERVLFPAIRALVAGTREFAFGTVHNPISMLQSEHEQAGELLTELRAVTHDFHVPEDACASYRSLYQRLEHLEADTHRHIHLENNVLFPMAVALEKS